MALIKPSWLHNYFLGFNFTLFGTTMPVGDAMEYAVDYIFVWIDQNLTMAVMAMDKAYEVGQSLVTTEQYLTNRLTSEIDRVIGLIAQVVPGLAQMWEVLRPLVGQMIEANVAGVVDLTREVAEAQDGLQVIIDRVQEDYALRSWVMDALEARRQTTEEQFHEIHNRMGLVEEQTESLWEMIGRFFDDPLAFFLELFLGWLVGNLDTLFSTIEDALWGEA